MIRSIAGKYKCILLFALFFCFKAGVAAVGPPSLRCASVNADGSVTLTWVAPSNPLGEFVRYQLYFSANKNGPYTGPVNIPVSSTYLHSNNANLASYYYYMISEYIEGGITKFSGSSDTLSTMKLDVTDKGNGSAMLIWNALHSPELSTSNGKYYIHKEDPIGLWSIIDSTTSLIYNDVFSSVCLATYNYKVEIRNNSGCSSFSSVDGKTFKDITPPGVTIVDSVSIDAATGFPYICWQPNSATDVCYYNIYVYDPTKQPVYDSIFSAGASQTCFLLQNQSPCNAYRIVAVDCCTPGNPGAPSAEHNTICLNYSFTGCSDNINLTWNRYRGWAGGVNNYRIYASESSGPFLFVGSTTPGDTTFTHTGVTLNANYCYYIRAFENGSSRTSSSSVVCFNTGVQQAPTSSYLEYATVKNKTTVELSYSVVPVPGTFTYLLERRKNEEAFTKVKEIPPAQLAVNKVVLTDDSLLNTSENSYTYRVSVQNVCGKTVLTSNLAKTILLKGTNNSNSRINSLTWTPYVEWENGVANYSLFRSVNGIFDPLPAVSLADSSYNDNLDPFYTSEGTFCYYVEAYERPGPVNNMNSVSRSNELCLVQEPNFYVPNAFTPGPEGLNPIFKPGLSYVDYENYKFYIFNRWGQMVFETEDPLSGWDGTIKGGAAETGLYVYRIRYSSSSGEELEKAGSVMLLR